MPTIFTHPAVPLALAVAGRRGMVSPRLLAAGFLCSVAPDLDVLTHAFGAGWGSFFGHRGITHTLGFALLLAAICAALYRPLHTSVRTAFVFTFICTWSHPILDAFTDGGSGIPLLWPLSGERFFFPLRVLEVSPLGLHFFGSGRALSVLKSELIGVWLPLAVAAALAFAARRIRSRRTA
jgi:inner membrane protein